MIRSIRLHRWIVSAGLLAALAAGCQSAKPPKLMGKKADTPATGTASAIGSPEVVMSNKLQNPVKVHLAYGVWHEQEGNLIEARNAYDKVLEESPKNVDAMLGLSRLDIALGRMDDAEKRLLKAQKLAPKNPQVAIALGQYFSARNDLPRAMEHMQMARSLSPYDPACAYHLGLVQAKSGDMTSALANFTEAVGGAEAQYNLAFILHEQGNLLAAEEHLQRAIALKPDLAQAQSLLLTVRQKRSENRTDVAQNPGMPAIRASTSAIQPASYSEPARISSFDPAPVRH